MIAAVAFVFVFGSLMLEARVSAEHERALRALGAREPPHDVYWLMQLIYPASFAVMLAEGFVRGTGVDRLVVGGALVWAGAKALKYWAIITLGDRWTFRVLVPPRSSRIVAGPYRWLRHPNYVAVGGELIGTALAMHAWISGLPAIVTFVAVMRSRVAIEERALAEAQPDDRVIE